MTLTGYIAIAVVILMIIALLKEMMRPGLVLFTALVIFMVTNIITSEEALSGFSNKGMITVGMLFLVSEGFKQTGALSKLAGILLPKKRAPIPRLILRLTVPIAGVSAFLNNTPVVIIFAPMIKKWAEKLGLPSQKFLIPLSYATIFGGTCTLIGTSTNLVVHGMMLDRGIEGLGFFELAKVGIFVAIIGFIYLNIFSNRLLPGEIIPRHSFPNDIREYYFDVMLTEGSSLIGKEIEKRRLPGLSEFVVKTVIRDEKHIRISNTAFTIEERDELILAGKSEDVGFLMQQNGIKLKCLESADPAFMNQDLKLVEVVIAPRFPGIQKTIEEFDFRGHYNAVVMAVHRNGERITTNMQNVELKSGDNLMLITTDDFTRYWGESRAFYMASEIGDMDSSKDRRKRWLAVIITLLMVVGATVGGQLPSYGDVKLDMFFFAAIAMVLMASMKIFSAKKYTKPINWDVLITVASAFGISRALQNSGAADMIAHTTINISKNLGPIGVLAAIYIITNIFTEIITNNAAAALSFPIALAAATQLGVDPRPFFIAIAVAASASFSTPIGYQTNLVVQSIGNYKFGDYWKIGLPLNILAFIISIIVIPIFWSF
ncbi:MAG: SLC13 family permease [Bacteroidales bacterium]|nr:SLC13 family permease [Bacteroidales bacterium]MDT8430320.1 SLC13 family permease [Bacteroidales bacterium]